MAFLQKGREYLGYGVGLYPREIHGVPTFQGFGWEQKGTIPDQLLLNPLSFSAQITKSASLS